jgi:hypothetical protein
VCVSKDITGVGFGFWKIADKVSISQ